MEDAATAKNNLGKEKKFWLTRTLGSSTGFKKVQAIIIYRQACHQY